MLSSKLENFGFEQSDNGTSEKVMILMTYVDVVMVARKTNNVEGLREHLNKLFLTEHIGEKAHYNGCC